MFHAGKTPTAILIAAMMASLTACSPSGIDTKDKTAIEKIVRDYLLEHPEVLHEAAQRYNDKQSSNKLDPKRAVFEQPFAGAWAGAAKGDVTVVMFTDYNCGYCRSTVTDVERLLKEDPNVRVVWRELPVLGPASTVAARYGLAAARQNKYREFHHQVFASGHPDENTLTQIAQSVGLDMAQLKRDLELPVVAAEIDANHELARQFALDGTPSFIIGNEIIVGAPGYDGLTDAIAKTRKAKS